MDVTTEELASRLGEDPRLVVLDVRTPQEFEGTVVPAAEVHAAFMAALQFGYAKLVSTEEYLAGASGN